ncbi:MAG: SDR family oxidoreductase [Planctomycetota bacterium]|nr:SDR family oxidoreductase [Planctomycetota bacterium]
MSKNVLITGGSSGIGAGLVRAFANAEYTVWFTYNRGEPSARELTAGLSDRDVQHFPLDLGDWNSQQRLLELLPGPVEILINNAGLGTKTVEHQAPETHLQDQALMQVNAVGTLWLTQALLPAMRERGFGKIVFLSSVGGGITQFPGFRLADGMSKAAIAHLGRQLAAELSHEAIDVFTVCPGAVDTPMFRQSSVDHLSEEERGRLMEKLPGARMIEPGEIADLIMFLCTPEARVLRGAVLDASLGLGVHPGLLDRR